MSRDSFTCKYCSHHSTLTYSDVYSVWYYLDLNQSVDGRFGYRVFAVTCPNPACNKLSLDMILTEADGATRHGTEGVYVKKWQLMPDSDAKVLPDYVPQAIREDYLEACKIKNLSPKASATLARRCLQGMIRDYFGISKNRLAEEIEAIKEKIDPDTYSAIDAVRKVGNIGAHMERDINVIIDVEPNEAQLLIELIEQLIDDWYVSRKSKQDRLAKITELAKSKKEGKNE